MIVRHSENELFETNQQFEEAQRYKKWTFNNIPPHTKGGMKDVYELLKEGNLEDYYKVIVHINTPMDCKLNETSVQDDKQNQDTHHDSNGYKQYKKSKGKKANHNQNGKEGGTADVKSHSLKYLSEHKHGLLLSVNVKPNAKDTCIVDSDREEMNIRISAKPTDGAANKELTSYIAKLLGCSKSDVTVHRGHKSRDKVLLIQRKPMEEVVHKIVSEL